MPAFEITARDESTFWVWCETEQRLRDSMKGTYCSGIADLDEVALGLTPNDYSFIMPKDVQALHDHLRELAGIPRLNQMVRGADYMCERIIPAQRVTFIASDPDDGAYLICKYWDTDTDGLALIGCEASDLRFLPPEENQKP